MSEYNSITFKSYGLKVTFHIERLKSNKRKLKLTNNIYKYKTTAAITATGARKTNDTNGSEHKKFVLSMDYFSSVVDGIDRRTKRNEE